MSAVPGAGDRLEKYLDSARETYELAKLRFLYTTFADIRTLLRRDVLSKTAKFLRLLIEPLSSLVGRKFQDQRLRQVLGYPAVFLGSSPYLTPSMYHLMSHLDLADGVLYPIGGFTRVIESIADLARAEGATVITRAEVTRIVVEDGKATGVEYLDGNRDIQFADADIVVSAADLHHSETELLKPEEQTYPQEYWDTKTPGPSALLLYLGVEGELPQLEHHTLLFTREWERGFDAIFGTPSSVQEIKMKRSIQNETHEIATENIFDETEITNNVLDFSTTLRELRKTVDPHLIRQRAGRRDRNGQMHMVEYVEWHTVADILDEHAPNWAHTVKDIRAIGDIITVTVAITINGITREGVGTGKTASETGIKKANTMR